MPSNGSPVPLLKFQMVPRLGLLTSSGSKKKEYKNMQVWVKPKLDTHTKVS
jgi:hypothetical protein